MESNQEFSGNRWIAGLIFASVVTAVVCLIVLSFVFGGYSQPGTPPFFFFGWWILIPIFLFGFFFFFRLCGWGYWWYPRRYYSYDPALTTLRERFARGEITKEQYDQMRRDLEQTT